MSRMPSPMVPMAWPITATVLHSELKSVREAVERWEKSFGDEGFLVELDNLDDISRQQVFGQLVNELKVCASKAATLVEVLA